MGRANSNKKPSQERSTDLVIMLDVPSSLRSLSEQTYVDFVRYVGGDAKHDVEVKYGAMLSNFKLRVHGRTQLVFKWEALPRFEELAEIGTFLRERWDYHCRRALLTLLQSDSANNELKKDIDKIDAYVADKQGSECYEKGDYDKAIDLFRRAVSLYPYYSMFYNNLGNALAMKERYDEAVQNLKLALRIDPRNKKASKNLSAVITRGLMRSGRQATVFCPFPECEGRISVTLPRLGGSATARCPNCDSAQVVIGHQGVEQIGIYKHTANPDFPRVLVLGLLDDLRAVASGLWLLDDANVLLKPSEQPDYVKDHDCVFEIELYHVRHGVMPMVRVVLVILDHPKNPSVASSVCNIASPRSVAHLRYLKTISKINLHVYDSQNHYCFTKEVPVAEAPIENSGGPVGAPLKRVEIKRSTWPDYVEALIETAKSMCQLLPPDFLDFKQASAKFNSHPISCLCEICGRQAVTTKSQFRKESRINMTKLKTSDAIQCIKCNLVLCIECALKRAKIDEQDHVTTPLTCLVCGEPFSAF